MIKFIKNYFSMKVKEIELKTVLYSSILTVINEKNDIVTLTKNLYISLKDVPMEDLRTELIKNIAHLAHERSIYEREHQN